MLTWLKCESALDHAIFAYTLAGPAQLEGPIDIPSSPARIALQDAILKLAEAEDLSAKRNSHTCMHLASTGNPRLQALIPPSASAGTSDLESAHALLREDPFRFFALTKHGFRILHQHDGKDAVATAATLINEGSPLAAEITTAIKAYVFPKLTIADICDAISDAPYLADGPATDFLADLIESAHERAPALTIDHFMVPFVSDLGCVIYALLGYRIAGGDGTEESLRSRLLRQAGSQHGRLRLKTRFGTVKDVLRGPQGDRLRQKMAQYNRDGARAAARATVNTSKT